MQSLNFEEIVENIIESDTRFDRDAYFFLRDALDHTQRSIGKSRKVKERHVSGRQLLEGIREYALSQFGPMTITVLEEWGIRSTDDFGEMVFNLIEQNVLAKTETDSKDDFKSGYDFIEAFQKPFIPASKTVAEPKPAH